MSVSPEGSSLRPRLLAKRRYFMSSAYVRQFRVATSWPVGAVSKTKQSFASECNINNIVKKFMKTGSLPVVNVQAMFGDFSNVPDYQLQCNRINAVKSVFASLAPEVRAKFDHDPSNMLNFVNDPKNVKECVDLGLLPKSAIPLPPSKYDLKTGQLATPPVVPPAVPPVAPPAVPPAS